MKGIFYHSSVPLIGLLQQYVPVSNALSKEQVAAPLSDAYDMFIRPLLGKEFSDSLCATSERIADGGSAKAEELEVLHYLRKATANLAFWYSFTELNTHITDQGFQRSEGDTYKPVYRYQELDLKRQFRNKGFNAVDDALRYLQVNTDFFEEYKSAPAYIDMQHSLVKGAQEIEKYYSVNGSYLVFLKLRPSFRRMADLFVEPVIGSNAMALLDGFLNGTEEYAEDKAALLEQLRSKVSAVVVCKALAEHVRNIGDITDRGLYYATIQATAGENQTESQAGDNERARQARLMEKTARHYLHALIRWMEINMKEVFQGHPEDAFNRDNDHKHTFWA